MVTVRACKTPKPDGSPCGAPPLLDGDSCIMHSNEHTEAMQEARRLGGLRKRREQTLQVVYEIEGLETLPQLRRLLRIAVLEALGMENSPARVGALLRAVTVGAKLMEVGELADQLAAIKGVLEARLPNKRRR